MSNNECPDEGNALSPPFKWLIFSIFRSRLKAELQTNAGAPAGAERMAVRQFIA
jgi:hypothetical protein